MGEGGRGTTDYGRTTALKERIIERQSNGYYAKGSKRARDRRREIQITDVGTSKYNENIASA